MAMAEITRRDRSVRPFRDRYQDPVTGKKETAKQIIMANEMMRCLFFLIENKPVITFDPYSAAYNDWLQYNL